MSKYKVGDIDDTWWVDERLITGLVTPTQPPSDSPQVFDWYCDGVFRSQITEESALGFLKSRTEDAIRQGNMDDTDILHLYKLAKHATAVVKCETTVSYTKVGE